MDIDKVHYPQLLALKEAGEAHHRNLLDFR
jgi:hypothetical protein